MTRRIEREMGIDELARITRIGEPTLHLIEAQNLERLPAPVFVQGFLSAYARAVGADGDEAVRRYQDALARRDQFVASRSDAGPVEAAAWHRLLAPTLLVSAWMVVSVWLLDPALHDGSGAGQGAVAPQAVAPRHEAAASAVPAEPAPAPPAYQLEVVAREATWFQVVVDGQAPRQLRLESGQRIDLAARTGFVLLLGDAGAVSLQLNGRGLPAPGARGQVKTLYLP